MGACACESAVDWLLHLLNTHGVAVGVCVCVCLFLSVCDGAMGWLRLVDTLNLQVSFAKEPYKRDDILQKRTIISRNLLIIAIPHIRVLSVRQ